MTVPTRNFLRLLATCGLAVLFLHVALPLGAQAPPLGELARKEQERRKTVKAGAKVFSNKDLPKPPPPPPAEAPGAGAPSTPTTPPVVTAEGTQKEAKSDERNEDWWRARMLQAREAQRRGEAFADALQSRINALSADAVNRDDPFQRARAAEDRQKAVAELARVTAEIDQAKKEIVAIEEEARKGGVPPGWIR